MDEVTAYVFSLRPKAIEKGKQYFQGMVWVDDRDLQIVKSEGKQVPEIKMKHGEENLFPRFTTWREQIDGKFWFPTFTLADDTLYFQGGPGPYEGELSATPLSISSSNLHTRLPMSCLRSRRHGPAAAPESEDSSQAVTWQLMVRSPTIRAPAISGRRLGSGCRLPR